MTLIEQEIMYHFKWGYNKVCGNTKIHRSWCDCEKLITLAVNKRIIVIKFGKMLFFTEAQTKSEQSRLDLILKTYAPNYPELTAMKVDEKILKMIDRNGGYLPRVPYIED